MFGFIFRNDLPLKLEANNSEPSDEIKKRSRKVSSSTTRTKGSRHSAKSNNDERNDSTKSLKKTHSNMNSSQFLPSPASQQQIFQNLFQSFQNQANYWPMSPWPVPPSLALMTDPRNYYTQTWPPPPPAPQSSAVHGLKDLSSASLNDFIGETSSSVFPLPSSSALINPTSNFSRTPSSNSLHLHHATNRHRSTTLNGTFS